MAASHVEEGRLREAGGPRDAAHAARSALPRGGLRIGRRAGRGRSAGRPIAGGSRMPSATARTSSSPWAAASTPIGSPPRSSRPTPTRSVRPSTSWTASATHSGGTGDRQPDHRRRAEVLDQMNGADDAAVAAEAIQTTLAELQAHVGHTRHSEAGRRGPPAGNRALPREEPGAGRDPGRPAVRRPDRGRSSGSRSTTTATGRRAQGGPARRPAGRCRGDEQRLARTSSTWR